MVTLPEGMHTYRSHNMHEDFTRGIFQESLSRRYFFRGQFLQVDFLMRHFLRRHFFRVAFYWWVSFRIHFFPRAIFSETFSRMHFSRVGIFSRGHFSRSFFLGSFMKAFFRGDIFPRSFFSIIRVFFVGIFSREGIFHGVILWVFFQGRQISTVIFSKGGHFFYGTFYRSFFWGHSFRKVWILKKKNPHFS